MIDLRASGMVGHDAADLVGLAGGRDREHRASGADFRRGRSIEADRGSRDGKLDIRRQQHRTRPVEIGRGGHEHVATFEGGHGESRCWGESSRLASSRVWKSAVGVTGSPMPACVKCSLLISSIESLPPEVMSSTGIVPWMLARLNLLAARCGEAEGRTAQVHGDEVDRDILIRDQEVRRDVVRARDVDRVLERGDEGVGIEMKQVERARAAEGDARGDRVVRAPAPGHWVISPEATTVGPASTSRKTGGP